MLGSCRYRHEADWSPIFGGHEVAFGMLGATLGKPSFIIAIMRQQCATTIDRGLSKTRSLASSRAPAQKVRDATWRLAADL
jgi:hypothetical protein